MGLQYRDDESDLITLQSDADLTEARQGAELKVVVTSKQLCPSEECKVWEELKATAGQQFNKLFGYWQEAKAAAAKQELPHPIFLLMAPLLLFGCPLMRLLLALIAVVCCGCCPFVLLPLWLLPADVDAIAGSGLVCNQPMQDPLLQEASQQLQRPAGRQGASSGQQRTANCSHRSTSSGAAVPP